MVVRLFNFLEDGFMKIQDALNILGLGNGQIKQEDIKQAYRKAAFKYHPDRNPAGLEMMKLVNGAYEALKDFEGESVESRDYGEAINAALNVIVGLGLTIEICGAWVWVTGDTKPHKEILKMAGFLWSPKKPAWYFRSEENKVWRNKKSLSLDAIREKYGSEKIKNEDLNNKKLFKSTYISNAQAI